LSRLAQHPCQFESLRTVRISMQLMVSLIHPLIVEPTYDQPLTPTALCQGRNRSTSYLETVPSTEQQSPIKLYRF